MSGIVELKLYSPLQVDIIDRDTPGHAIPFQALGRDRLGEYTGMTMKAFRALQSQEDARDAFVSPDQDWSEVCDKIVSLTRTVEVVDGRLYGVYTCRSQGELRPNELDDLEWYCHDQWENGWGEGYACCPCEGAWGCISTSGRMPMGRYWPGRSWRGLGVRRCSGPLSRRSRRTPSGPCWTRPGRPVTAARGRRRTG